MRWLFANDAERASTMQAVAGFWGAFQRHTRELNQLFSGEGDFDLVGFMQEHLGAVHPNLMWEFGPGIGADGHRLALSPEHRHELTEVARALVFDAPEIEGWQFFLGRPPEPADSAAHLVQGRTGGDISDLRVSVEAGRANLIDLRFFSERADNNDAYLAAQTVLGETLLASWVGGIVVEQPDGDDTGAVPLSELHGEVARVQQRILAALPTRADDEPLDDAETTLIETPRDQASDYPMLDDRVTWLAPSVAFVEAVFHGWFSSERFSTSGEVFAFLKIDGTHGLDGSGFVDRAQIENEVDHALRAVGAGRVYGSGHGLTYSYIDLALTDLGHGSEIALATLAAGNIAKRTWLQLHDRKWIHEWLGAYPDTPPPPLAS